MLPDTAPGLLLAHLRELLFVIVWHRLASRLEDRIPEQCCHGLRWTLLVLVEYGGRKWLISSRDVDSKAVQQGPDKHMQRPSRVIPPYEA